MGAPLTAAYSALLADCDEPITTVGADARESAYIGLGRRDRTVMCLCSGYEKKHFQEEVFFKKKELETVYRRHKPVNALEAELKTVQNAQKENIEAAEEPEKLPTDTAGQLATFL